MRMDPHPYEVRELVARSFQELGAEIHTLFDVDETILVSDGKYAARSYRVDGFMAMWLVEVGIVQFYDADGAMVRTVNLLQHREAARLAA
ncbi:unnamed protein product [marine sediment metagenome]|uniref:Uncharacterized protein n=1 Tax=marine sediment metagenome TaxID=412755 RepID=X0V8W6_9ZZZZ